MDDDTGDGTGDRTRDGSDGFWFDAAPLRRRGAARALLRRPGGRDPRLDAFAAANGLVGEPELDGVEPTSRLRRHEGAHDVLRTTTEPVVEFGNTGSVLGIVEMSPGDPRRGLVAVRHGLALPPVHTAFRGLGTKSLANLASTSLAVATLFDWSASSESTRPSAPPPVTLTEHRDVGVAITTLKGRESEAWRLVTPEVVPRLAALTESFGIRVDREWMLAECGYGDVTTTDPEIWAWVFSTASRMIDLAHAWRAAGWPPVDEADPLTPWDLREVPFYTSAWIPRPAKVDGVLSRSSLARLRPGRGEASDPG